MKKKRSNRRRPAIEALEKRMGQSLREIAEDYAAKGYSRKGAAEDLGMRVATFIQALHAICPDVDWPAPNQSIGRRAANRQIARLARQRMRDQGRAIMVEHQGKRMSLTELARANDLSPSTVIDRYHAGRSGSDLLTKPHPTQGKPDAVYELGVSLSEWEIIADYARERSIAAAYRKFGVPKGAISAVLADELERVA